VAAIALGGSTLLMMGAKEPPALTQIAERSEIDLRVGRNNVSGRLEIYGTIGSRASLRKDKDELVIRFPTQKKPDLGDIRANIPIGVEAVQYQPDTRSVEIRLKIKKDYEVRFGRSDGGVYAQFEPKDRLQTLKDQPKTIGIDLDEAIEEQEATKPELLKGELKESQIKEPAAQGPLSVELSDLGGGKVLSFGFDTIVPAAVFRRGEAVWIVFDTDVELKLPVKIKDGQIIEDVVWARSDGFTALRLKAPSAGSVSVQSQGLNWRVGIGTNALGGNFEKIKIVTDRSSGAASLSSHISGAKRVAYLLDPSVGDRLAVVPAQGPIKRLLEPKIAPEASLFTTAHGLVVERMASDVQVTVINDHVEISRAGGLNVSLDPKAEENKGPTNPLDYPKAQFPSLIDPSWGIMPPEGFLARYQALSVAASEEGRLGLDAPVEARINLARFLSGQGLYFEAQGLLDMTIKRVPKALDNVQVRGLRAAAKIHSGREQDAMVDLTAPLLMADPVARLWQALAETKARHYKDALKSFAQGEKALMSLSPQWRSKLTGELAHGAMSLGDLKEAERLAWLSAKQDAEPLDQLRGYLVLSQVLAAKGEKERALGILYEVSKATQSSISVPAQMLSAKLNYDLEKINAAETLKIMDALRFQWRGDSTELEIIRTTGDIYLSLGRYREALQILKAAGTGFKDRPEAIEIQQLLSTTFRSLFLGGLGDGLQPVEALALFKDFRELTPLGSEGDEMVRKIVRRLVGVDLLDQAAELLDYQVNERLEGPAKASIAGDLAAIHLMNRQPQKALQILWDTRTTLLPKQSLFERRLLEARALIEVNQPDKALDALGPDKSREAQSLRAEIYHKQGNHALAAKTLEPLLGTRHKVVTPLSPAEEGLVLRTGIAYSLAKDEKGLAGLAARYQPFIEQAISPDALRVVLAPIEDGPVSVKDFGAATTSMNTFASWVDGMKRKFREAPDVKPPANLAPNPALAANQAKSTSALPPAA
jgi:tetratricopeptide (TPR) repeat protein